MTFALRPYEATDEDFVVSSWIYSYARSRYGVVSGAHVPQAMPGYSKRPTEEDWGAFWCEQQPIVVDLIGRTNIQIACDADAPDVIWGWACTSGGADREGAAGWAKQLSGVDVVHNILVKRSVHRASAEADNKGVWRVTTGVSGDIYRALLGHRLEVDCGYTYELVDMRRAELRAQGVVVPRSWYADTTWFARERKVAA